jgi:hypothetical protein
MVFFMASLPLAAPAAYAGVAAGQYPLNVRYVSKNGRGGANL